MKGRCFSDALARFLGVPESSGTPQHVPPDDPEQAAIDRDANRERRQSNDDAMPTPEADRFGSDGGEEQA